jgi:hypothetical protein
MSPAETKYPYFLHSIFYSFSDITKQNKNKQNNTVGDEEDLTFCFTYFSSFCVVCWRGHMILYNLYIFIKKKKETGFINNLL